MPGGFPLGLEVCNGNAVGAVTGTSSGTVLTTSATANTKGAYAQLTASCPVDACWAIVFGDVNQMSSEACSVDIAVGSSGNEKIVAADLVFASGDQVFDSYCAGFPLQIAAGQRVAARAQSVKTGAQTIAVFVTLFDGANTMMEGAAGVDALGFVSGATHGTTVTASASANTKGSYTQLIASTARDYMGLFVIFDQTTATTVDNRDFLVDIAIGGSGSEQPIIPNIGVGDTQTENTNLLIPTPSPAVFPFVPIQIPAGTRIAARIQSSTSSAVMNMTVYGVYQ